MTEKQLEFLREYVMNYKDGVTSLKGVSQTIGVDLDTLRQWYNEDLRTERERFARVKAIYNRKKIMSLSFEAFYNWYTAHEKRCEYCGITQDELDMLHANDRVFTKRARGKTLELERKIPGLEYDVQHNLTLCCYWCNNAKTDTFTHEEFMEIGKVMRTIWNKRLAR